MSWKPLGTAAAVLALLAFSSTIDRADARHGSGHHTGAGHFVGGPAFIGGRSHVLVHHHHRRVFVGAYPYYYYDDGCYSLRRRALYTGSAYWWERYNACRYGYGY